MRAKKLTGELGVSLVELMVTIVIAMLVVLAVLNVFLASTRIHKTTENLSRIQENARIAFELMAFDLRQAEATPCGKVKNNANVINTSEGMPWFTTTIQGYESSQSVGGTAAESRATGTDAIAYGLPGSGGAAIENHSSGGSAQFRVESNNHGISVGDVVMACDNNFAALFQVTNVNESTETVVHNTGSSVRPGNCEKKYVAGTTCADIETIGKASAPAACGVLENNKYYEFCANGTLVKYLSMLWFIGCNGRESCSSPGGRSLYQIQFPNSAQEVVPDVQNMQIKYLKKGGSDYVDASSVTEWSNITAVRVELTLLGTEKGATTSTESTQRLTRTLSQVINLRNQSL